MHFMMFNTEPVITLNCFWVKQWGLDYTVYINIGNSKQKKNVKKKIKLKSK